MESAPVPPMTIALPVPIVMSSLPPMPGSVVSTSPTVIGSEPNGDGLSAIPRILPASPRMMFVSDPPLTMSPPWPAMTTFRPVPIVIVSFAPSAGVVE